MCGTESPINEIGPQYAVVMAVRYPEMSMIITLLRLIFNPKFSAYVSPRSSMFKFFGKKNVAANPIIMLMLNTASFLVPIPEKLPIPHTTNECMSSFML